MARRLGYTPATQVSVFIGSGVDGPKAIRDHRQVMLTGYRITEVSPPASLLPFTMFCRAIMTSSSNTSIKNVNLTTAERQFNVLNFVKHPTLTVCPTDSMLKEWPRQEHAEKGTPKKIYEILENMHACAVHSPRLSESCSSATWSIARGSSA
ncbi:hypothetical protein K458DRAFT_396423 [Lentithecium fluviatile CBS 122367]|uniref:Uncharacterized protein n=1 Tax=Lentithecium fluviatile CBS 122367 TaxID=1168545 RepID=A0A6G1IFH7_9PLEO|nr:hypothetical protein K458DRAFT_396423 [Lentithecium fluviatile CBS 122367]